MELNQLLQFKTIAECGSLTQAARQLYISQPTLSSMLKKLESELGVRLFDRAKNKIMLNEAGKLAYRHARSILEQTQAMKKELEEYSQRDRLFRVGFCDPGPMWYCVPKFSIVYPELELKNELYAPDDDELCFLLNGRFDLLITAHLPAHREIESRPLLRDQTLLSVPPDSPAASLKEVSLRSRPVPSYALFNLDGAFSRLKTAFFEELKASGTDIAMYTDYFLFSQKIRASSAATTTTRIVQTYRDDGKDRVLIPVTDSELFIQYSMAYLKSEATRLKPILTWLDLCIREFTEIESIE